VDDSWVEMRPTVSKAYQECLEDIDRVVSVVPNRGYHFFFEYEAGFDYALRLNTDLSSAEVAALIEAELEEKFVVEPYELEVENFGGALEECYSLFEAISKVALKIALLGGRGRRVEADDILHLVANVLTGRLVDEAHLCCSRARRALDWELKVRR